jgi:pyruvate kinase
MINTVRAVNEKYGYCIKILQDLEGYRIRICQLKQPITLEKKQHVWISNTHCESPDFIPLDLDINLKSLMEGMHVFINDGMICLRVIDHQGEKVKLEVENGGIISSKKGVNIPELKLDKDILTAKDKGDLAFGIENNVDYVAQSFVRNKHDILRVIDIVKPNLPDCKFIAKIENRQGIENIESIIDACDGIMIARGDLGVSLPIYQIPFIQKDIIRRCNKKKKFVITATQMLESMTEHPRPTRAEVSDIANAILDGSDYLMLSGETAVGRYPVESVEMMCQIMEFAKK